MITAHVKSAKKNTVIKDDQRFIDVDIELRDGKETHTVKRGYPLGTTQKEIEKDLKKMVATYKSDKAQAETQRVEDEAEAAADKTVAKVEGAKVTDK